MFKEYMEAGGVEVEGFFIPSFTSRVGGEHVHEEYHYL